MVEALDIWVKGIVQGVGFRPFVYRLARRNLINGWVLNAVDGVHIHAEGESQHLDEFVMELSENAPAAAQVTEIEMHEVPLEPFDSFEIRFSEDDAAEESTLVSPDLALCADCERELFDPADRRFRYPFINCTNCGPRFTITDALPYDRANTSMREFPMCSACRAEYEDPADRRFHAQPDACFTCGPHLTWRWSPGDSRTGILSPSAAEPSVSESLTAEGDSIPVLLSPGTRDESDALLARAAHLLADGGILAVKGLGGYHLACDARNPEAVARLRQRKGRDGKAFAVMTPTVEDARTLCSVSTEEEAVLTGMERPIVLLRKRADAEAPLPAEVSGALPELGVMLPYTPVQHLLLHDFAEVSLREGCANKSLHTHEDPADGSVGEQTCFAHPQPGTMPPVLVMTSGNVHDEPIVTNDEEAFAKLSGIADAFLGNDREILTRFDDTVLRVLDFGSDGGAVQFIRRARGYAPAPIHLGSSVTPPATEEGHNPGALPYDQPASSPVAAQPGTHPQGESVGRGLAPAQPGTHPQDESVGRGLAPAQPGTHSQGESVGKGTDLVPFLGDDRDGTMREPRTAPTLFATGPEQKNTFTFLRAVENGAEAFVSQHIGDVENVETFDAWLSTKARYETLFGLEANALACDLHPEYLTTKWALEQAALTGDPLTRVQHHQAHIVAALAENDIPGPVCGIAFDGTGYGTDGNIWGGEVLLSNLAAFERFANFAYVPMPGGAAAIKHPLRMAYGVLWEADLLDHPGAARALEALGEEQARVCQQMVEQGLNTPVTSSVGRLFDAASALLGVCTEPTYEGEAAILLEAAMDLTDGASPVPTEDKPQDDPMATMEEEKPDDRRAGACPCRDDGWQPDPRYTVNVVKNTASEGDTAETTSVVLLDAAPVFTALLDDVAANVPVPVIARRFHDAMVGAIVTAAQMVNALYDIHHVVLTGGVFMNRYVVENSVERLTKEGFTVILNRELPPNDGCVSLGQAVSAANRV